MCEKRIHIQVSAQNSDSFCLKYTQIHFSHVALSLYEILGFYSRNMNILDNQTFFQQRGKGPSPRPTFFLLSDWPDQMTALKHNQLRSPP